jgi:orotate phosphoribosyltransferase
VTVVEDVLTTGGAVRDATCALRELGATITTVVAAIDRSGHDGGLLRDVGLETRAALANDDLDTARAAASVPGAAF